MPQIHFSSVRLPRDARDARDACRAFLADEISCGNFVPHQCSWSSFDPEFSRRAGRAGFIGMTFPPEFGGKGSSSLCRFVVTEEMLAAGAPCGAHWIADRQSGPQVLRHGSERAKREIIPAIAAGECYFGIGMSEPNAGSDLAAVNTRAEKVPGGWVINGSKIWTTNAHQAHYLIALVRSGTASPRRQDGLTQFLIDMSHPGVSTRPVLDIGGHHEFNEVLFSDHFVADDMVIGAIGDGWSVLTEELAFERSGPDRFLSDFRLFVELVDRVGPQPDAWRAIETGRIFAKYVSLMRMSVSIADQIGHGKSPEFEAALVKDIGTGLEREIPEISRRLVEVQPRISDPEDRFSEAVANVLLRAPSFSLRGGTREILRGVIARGLGLR